ncbi:hypothetical protein [Deinococcus sp. Marseille-Q6407]|uniref:hypothetical protein n=1 Tax=Deinococcus sp. Marseille-Q6407 TaxID=2969223 RepID=UPI0021C1F860|nr:hypothetical protein [Deinococcus sp. Marseille-Q6407]
MRSQAKDIVTLRLSHCRAERAAQEARYHLAVMHYRSCLETAERREDCQAVQFFALRLAECYEQMNLNAKARAFRDLAQCAAAQPDRQWLSRPDSDGPAAAPLH